MKTLSPFSDTSGMITGCVETTSFFSIYDDISFLSLSEERIDALIFWQGAQLRDAACMNSWCPVRNLQSSRDSMLRKPLSEFSECCWVSRTVLEIWTGEGWLRGDVINPSLMSTLVKLKKKDGQISLHYRLAQKKTSSVQYWKMIYPSIIPTFSRSMHVIFH